MPPDLAFAFANTGRRSLASALLGLAVGDALGAPLEGASQEHASAAVAEGLEMTGNRWWAPGEWTDDTAMALALAESIVEQGLIDIDDVARRYIEWADRDGKGIGRATARALVGARDAEEARTRARAQHKSGALAAGNGTSCGLRPHTCSTARVSARAGARPTGGTTGPRGARWRSGSRRTFGPRSAPRCWPARISTAMRRR